MENIAYYNGKISLIEDMMIPMNERSSYFGDGVYDAMFTVDHVPLQLDDHLRRFYRSAKKIEIDIATSRRSTCCPPSSTPSGRRKRAATKRFSTAATA